MTAHPDPCPRVLRDQSQRAPEGRRRFKTWFVNGVAAGVPRCPAYILARDEGEARQHFLDRFSLTGGRGDGLTISVEDDRLKSVELPD